MTATPELLGLIERTRSGDMAAFRALFERYAKRVLNFGFRMTGSREAAEEIVQETFVAVWKGLGGLNDPDRFEPWLFMIARNFVYQAHRKDRAGLVSLDAVGEDGEPAVKVPDRGVTPEAWCEQSELQAAAMEAIASLEPKYREVFVLAVLEGYSYKEVAGMVQRKVPSVKTDIHRARLKIREKLGPFLAGGESDEPGV
ncbi:MAG: RNA polymerase sigma factor [Acidobacteria bacterium]|nr:RNA polymerase sigma factor [Acidobacteriota bacterium]